MLQMTNEYGIELIKIIERLRLTWYDDGFGFRTIGYGHTPDKYFPFREGEKISIQQADDILLNDLKEAEWIVKRELNVDEMNHFQTSALVSIAFNSGSFKNYNKKQDKWYPSDLMFAINEGKPKEVIAPMLMYHDVYSGGNLAKGLLRRRRCERALFDLDNYDVPPEAWARQIYMEWFGKKGVA